MIVILYNIRSLHNVGSIFRTADAAGVEKIYLTGITPVPVDRFGKMRPQFAKVSLGAEKFMAWDDSTRSLRAIGKLLETFKKDGCKIFAVEQDKNSIPYYKLATRDKRQAKRNVLILGSETKGLPQSILKQCDKILEIPMRGALLRESRHPRRTGAGKESLNVAVSFGIVVFSLLGQNRK